MSEAEAPIPASDLPARFAMGVAMVAVALAAVWFGGGESAAGVWLFRLLVLAAAGVMLVEWGDMHRVRRPWSYFGVAMLAAILLIGNELLYPAGEMDEVIEAASFGPAWTGFGAAAAAALLLGLVARRLVMTTGFLYIAIPAIALIAIEWTWLWLVYWMMIVTWATDICAYFAGRGIGGPKLAPRVSPNKTWAGLIGGIVGAALFGWLVAWYANLGSPFTWLGAPMAVLAQAGDLFESALKRRAGVKDSGRLLPGHGGALDRLDGFLPVIVATFLVLAAGFWTA